MFTKGRQVHYTYLDAPCLLRTDSSTMLTGVLHVYQGQTGPLYLQWLPCLGRTDRSTILTGMLHVYQGQTGPLYLQGHSMFTNGRQVYYTYRDAPCLLRTDRLYLQGYSMFTKDRQVHYSIIQLARARI